MEVKKNLERRSVPTYSTKMKVQLEENVFIQTTPAFNFELLLHLSFCDIQLR